jgi:Xaa-Pro aminopeptidase
MHKEKIKQVIDILNEKDIDMWLTFVRETETIRDPSVDIILGTNCTWQSAFIITRDGRTIAIVGSLDKERIKSTGLYNEIREYIGDFGKVFLATLDELKPEKIAINASKNDFVADGLTHGMYELLVDYTSNTVYKERLISSEELVSALRGRKSLTEIERIKNAIRITEGIFEKVSYFMKPGMTERDVANFILDLVEKNNVTTAWGKNTCPAVFTGPESAGAHAEPTNRVIKKGHVLNIDFGVKKDDYCSDLQRTWYFLRESEIKAPKEVEDGFQTIVDAIKFAADAIKPGKKGYEIDNIARSSITSKGYPEFPHALGHQVGRFAHDGAGVLAPRWERYGKTPYLEIEAGQVYTIEPRLPIKGYGIATIEEIIVVTEDGCDWLSHPQKELYLIG